jgi:hypothetical protein
MISQVRVALLESLAELSDHYPDWRFGRLVSNVAGWADAEIWGIEDDQFLASARCHIDQLVVREKVGGRAHTNLVSGRQTACEHPTGGASSAQE